MAKPIPQPPHDPLKQVPTPDGTFRDSRDEPSLAEQALEMWRGYMGNEPMPDRLKKHYGIPLDKEKAR
jgi:hypothetical protein